MARRRFERVSFHGVLDWAKARRGSYRMLGLTWFAAVLCHVLLLVFEILVHVKDGSLCLLNSPSSLGLAE